MILKMVKSCPTASSTTDRRPKASNHEPSFLLQATQLKLFSLNDYMGLSAHPRVCLAGARAAANFGMGEPTAELGMRPLQCTAGLTGASRANDS